MVTICKIRAIVLVPSENFVVARNLKTAKVIRIGCKACLT